MGDKTNLAMNVLQKKKKNCYEQNAMKVAS